MGNTRITLINFLPPRFSKLTHLKHKTMSKKEYNPGKIKPLIQIVARLVQTDPTLADDMDRLRLKLNDSIPSLTNKKKCANCGANMVENVYTIDVLDAILIITMAKVVKLQKDGMVAFTEANAVHVPTLKTTDAIRHRTTKCSKLGLVAKYKKDDGRHKNGVWVITRRGWAAIRGDLVPKTVKVWRNRITEHTGEMTNLYAVFNNHSDQVVATIEKGKKPKHDHREFGGEYNALDWVQWGNTMKGKLF